MLTEEFRDECERIAINMRRELGLWAYDPLSAADLLQKREIDLYRPDQLGMSLEDVAQAMSSSGWWAITVLTKPPMVIYHPRATKSEFEFNIMHELAHLLFGHKPEQLGLISDFRVARKYSKRQEFEADTLALALQFPRAARHYARQQRLSIDYIESHYHIDRELIRL